MLNIAPTISSRYLRTTSQINATTTLEFPDASKVRFFEEVEAEKFAAEVRKRNVFARHSNENDFYLKQVGELKNRTVIEVSLPGDPNEMSEKAEQIAGVIENLVIMSTILVLPKKDLLRKLGIDASRTSEIDFVHSNPLQFIRSRSRRTSDPSGLHLDERFCNRFRRCGFFDLFVYHENTSNLAGRVRTSADWLIESRRETKPSASVVKTAIALETLLIFSDSESLARTLSERAAFILSSYPPTRHQVSRIIKLFYGMRSKVVHGSQKQSQSLKPSFLEGVDRIVLLLYLIIAANSDVWPNEEALRVWCEDQRWGSPSSDIKIPFPAIYLNNALSMAEV